eukprot:CAMPEP_0174751872 /NCGR_PEP_ID=MMETSP1094-20130205/100732_1 /TAXON_ID=156173 /ORGANISM="Chrysochromulina brevifilum, Strain UTEX LB 985" /LENGTH=337 /DNA_ID=CAMNT_0015957417 /DNA_START=19 /DNA_END=1032 /DNA_ORIENTATION=+
MVKPGEEDDWKPAPVRGNDFYREALQWIRQNYPYWDRRGGRDHLFAFPHDEGACVAPIEFENATLLSSWGRLQPKPQNATTTMVEQKWFVPQFVNKMYASKHCYDPAKDILLPVFVSAKQIWSSPHLDAKPTANVRRTNLFHWRGQVLYHFPQYSFGIRQQLVSLFRDQESRGIIVSDKHSSSYLDEVRRSKFCGVFPGNGWGHIETPILLGCIPVVIQDDILTPWENVLDFSTYAIRVRRADLPRLPQILRAISDGKVAAMQHALTRVWERFTYSSLVLAERERRCLHGSTDQCRRVEDSFKLSPGRTGPRLTGKDAVDTLMQVLHARLLTPWPET